MKEVSVVFARLGTGESLEAFCKNWIRDQYWDGHMFRPLVLEMASTFKFLSTVSPRRLSSRAQGDG